MKYKKVIRCIQSLSSDSDGSSSSDWNGQTLLNGQYGEPVRQLQNDLASNDPSFYPNKDAENHGIDSYYGDNTEDAVRRYQSYYGLIVDGLAGKEVYSSLNGRSEGDTETVYLPASSSSWRIYPTDVAPTKGNEEGFLNPAKFDGLQYEVLAKRQADVVTIQSGDFGKGNIYVTPSQLEQRSNNLFIKISISITIWIYS